MPVSIRHQNRTCHKTQFILMFCVVLLLPLSQLQLLDATRCHCTVRRAGSLFFFFFFFHSNSPRSEQRIASHHYPLIYLFYLMHNNGATCPVPVFWNAPSFLVLVLLRLLLSASHRIASCRVVAPISPKDACTSHSFALGGHTVAVEESARSGVGVDVSFDS